MVGALSIELYTELALGLAFMALRIFAKWRTLGWRKVYWDDLFTLCAMVFWSVDVALLVLIERYGSTVGLTSKTAASLPPATAKSYATGMKLTFASWCIYLCLIWSFKACMLFFYHKLTLGLWQHRLVKVVSGLAIVTFVICWAYQLSACTPIRKSWQVVPYPGNHCTFRKGNYILFAILSIITDIGIMIIPLPMLWEYRLPLYHRAFFGLFFSSGLLLIAATLLRSIYSLRSLSDLDIATAWASREYLITAIVVSMPVIKPLLSGVRPDKACSPSLGGSPNVGAPSPIAWAKLPDGTKHKTTTTITGDVEQGSRSRRSLRPSSIQQSRSKERNASFSGESKEYILGPRYGSGRERSASERGVGSIMVATEYSVAVEEVGEKKIEEKELERPSRDWRVSRDWRQHWLAEIRRQTG